MSILKTLIISSLVFGSAYADGFGFRSGQFDLQFTPGEGMQIAQNIRAEMLDNVICSAITSQKKLVMTVQGKDITSTKEMQMVTKEITIEPYAFGVSKDGKPVLRGNVTEEKEVKEVTVKFNEDKFTKEQEEASSAEFPKKKGFFSGLFSSSGQNVDISQVVQVRVVEDSKFDAPSDFKGFDDASIQVICELPVKK